MKEETEPVVSVRELNARIDELMKQIDGVNERIEQLRIRLIIVMQGLGLKDKTDR
jgi:hypothetical protein